MPKFIVTLILAAVGGCVSAGGSEPDTSSLRCSESDNSFEVNRSGDRRVFQGRLLVDDEMLGFRPCDTTEIYLLFANPGLEHSLWQDALTQYADYAAPNYIRFNGYELDCGNAILDPYSGAVRLTDVQVLHSTIPPNCE